MLQMSNCVVEVTGKIVVFAYHGKMVRIYNGKRIGGYGHFSPVEYKSLIKQYHAIQRGR